MLSTQRVKNPSEEFPSGLAVKDSTLSLGEGPIPGVELQNNPGMTKRNKTPGASGHREVHTILWDLPLAAYRFPQ